MAMETQQQPATTANGDGNNTKSSYAFVRDVHDSVRLGLQHWIWSYVMDHYPLHPEAARLITEDEPSPERSPVRVCDIGCGNGVWLFELYRKLSAKARKNVHMTGLDLSSEYFPQPEDMPSSIDFTTLDIYGDVPEELIGAFDIVHIRMFAVTVRDNDPTPIMKNLVKLLKPGGYVQWDEMDVNTYQAHAPNAHVSTKASNLWIHTFLNSHRVALNKAYTWVPILASYFSNGGLEVVESIRKQTPSEFRTVMTTNSITAIENIARGLTDKDGYVVGSKHQWTELWGRMLEEVDQGVTIYQDFVMVVGRKLA